MYLRRLSTKIPDPENMCFRRLRVFRHRYREKLGENYYLAEDIKGDTKWYQKKCMTSLRILW